MVAVHGVLGLQSKAFNLILQNFNLEVKGNYTPTTTGTYIPVLSPPPSEDIVRGKPKAFQSKF